ncbi:hypothetical protein [Microbispora catharanthi]|uniref:hypothetical protein n=1 Tax=Microbispora catharanthi TaxID=1712871 RepID=UPI00142F16B7|nr:hypothetical protein [Microbispora catharanthi]
MADGMPGREGGPDAGEDLLAVRGRVNAGGEGGQALLGRPALAGAMRLALADDDSISTVWIPTAVRLRASTPPVSGRLSVC